MYELLYWTTPNGHKITMFLEEVDADYKVVPINIGKGEQFAPDFLKVSPNNRIPALIDHSPNSDAESISLFESGAILLYLAEKHERFIPTDSAGRANVLQWLFWQMANLGPMGGQNHHFVTYLDYEIEYAINRYVNEVSRLYAVLDHQLESNEYICGDYSIADMASYPWVVPHKRQLQEIEKFANLHRWFEQVRNRPATIRAYEVAKDINPNPGQMSEEEKKILFQQDASTLQSLRSGNN